jgi:hypothetical protein
MAEPSIKDIAYRTAASVFGGPVDLAAMVTRPFGYSTPDKQVMGGSEWIGKKMEDVGLVSTARAPLKELIASVAVPTAKWHCQGHSYGRASHWWHALWKRWKIII